jgi:hypothetical protein
MELTSAKLEIKPLKAITLTKENHRAAMEAIEREAALDHNRDGTPMAAILIEEAAKVREAQRQRQAVPDGNNSEL